MQQYQWNELSEAQQRDVLRRPAVRDDAALRAGVADIIARVRSGGDGALRELTERLDGTALGALEVTDDELARAGGKLSAAERGAIDAAAANIDRFHAAQLAPPISVDTAPGTRCERLSRPISSVGLYVPAGSAPLPSTALMLGIPARLAGCPARILCSPPRPDGGVDPAVLYAAQVAGVTRVFKAGGAQAVAAMAYGTDTVPKVDKIFGPGNAWVTEAKAQVDRDPDGAARDFPAGPSEVLVIADGTASPAFVAADLLSQAEHGPDSQVILVTTDAALSAAVGEQLELQQQTLPRRDIVAGALEASSLIVVEDLQTAIELSNRYAPEHLILNVAEPRRWLDRVQAAGSVFLGAWTPESVGDYCSGTNHVLPTYGFARRYSGLGVADFLRFMTVQELTRAGLERIGPIAETLAALEGLDAHARAVRARLGPRGPAQ
jgi:histidinol dehydrogenase